ncbi:hypothetical protein [Aureitalea marina]|uniref:Uncharacterized protein n=1 Tax=Aureitalea marina TaxID=930804 RepID=A0A2S7KNG3_9FLAO|nr:hypothetical protein [Aureitalea marina]PQB04128.1 hypothetical protein BST85_03830 [Aureitalea marina]
MKDISSSDPMFKQNITEFKDLRISVEGKYDRSGANFENCIFTVQIKSHINLSGCSLVNCSFIGAQDDPDDFVYKKSLVITSPTLVENISLEGDFTSIAISRTSIFGFNDVSRSDVMNLNDIDVFDFNIRGKCDELNLTRCFFSTKTEKIVAFWNKEIIRKAKCTNVIFDKASVNPYFLAAKCSDKSTLDLVNARLFDDWSRLRKKYSGIKLYIILVLTTLFFLPIITRSILLLIASSMNEVMIVSESVPLWKVIFLNNKSGWEGIVYLSLTLILLFYTIGRFVITLRIASLREEELFLSDSKFQLVSMPPSKYSFEIKMDKVLNWFYIIAILYSTYRFIETLLILVPTYS